MAFKKINQFHYIADTANDLKNIKDALMGAECYVITDICEYKMTSDGRWIKQKQETVNGEVDLSNYATKDDLNKLMEDTKANTTFGEDPEKMASNPGSAFGIAISNGETKTLPEAMLEKGIGLYTFWVHKSNPDLPAEVLAKKSSCRGLCCVDTVKDTGWYGWIQLFDHDGFMYTRYIRNSVPTDWHAC